MTRKQVEAFLAVYPCPWEMQGDEASAQDKLDKGAKRAAQRIMLYVAHGGVGLTVGQVVALRCDDELLVARTHKGEVYHLAMEDVFAMAAEASTEVERKAGFLASVG